MIHYWARGTALSWSWWCGFLHHNDFTGHVTLSNKVNQNLKTYVTLGYTSQVLQQTESLRRPWIFCQADHLTWIGSDKCLFGYLNFNKAPSEGSSHATVPWRLVSIAWNVISLKKMLFNYLTWNCIFISHLWDVRHYRDHLYDWTHYINPCVYNSIPARQWLVAWCKVCFCQPLFLALSQN